MHLQLSAVNFTQKKNQYTPFLRLWYTVRYVVIAAQEQSVPVRILTLASGHFLRFCEPSKAQIPLGPLRNFPVANVTGKSPTSHEEVGHVASLLRGSYEEADDFQTISTCQDGLATSPSSPRGSYGETGPSGI